MLSPSSKRDFQIAIFLDFYEYYDKNALNIPICALFYRLAVKLTAKISKIEKVLSPSIQNFLSKGGKNIIPFIHFA